MGKSRFEEAIQVSGSLTDDLMIDFVADFTSAKRQKKAFGKLTTELFKMGKEASRLVEEWLEFARDLLVAKQSGEAVGRSERFLQFKDESGCRLFIPLCGSFKPNATRNALHDETNDFT